MNVREYNRRAWDAEVARGNPWTVPVTRDEVERARAGDWAIVLTPTKPVPRAWFGDLAGAAVLGLASAGGQQGPILAAAGARVTVLDNSPAQLARDRQVADRDGLELTCVEGDMADLHMFGDASFDLVFHPCSNCFVPEVRPVWREAYRVLRPGGVLLAGVTNPMRYLFDDAAMQRGELTVRHRLPYSDLDLDEAERAARFAGAPLEFSHTLSDQLGGQLEAGFVLTDLFEDRYPVDGGDVLSSYLDTFIATRAVKLP